MQRVDDASLDRRRSRAQGLTEHLTAKHLRTADIAALAPEEVHLEGLELE